MPSKPMSFQARGQVLLLAAALLLGASACQHLPATSPDPAATAIVEAIRFDIEAALCSKDSHYASIDKDDAQRLYASLLEQAPLGNVPPRFAAAYLAHAKAWRTNDEGAIDATWEILSQEAAIHGICLEALELELLQ